MSILSKTIFTICFLGMVSLQAQDFVQVKGNQFFHQGKPYYFIGTNFWYGFNLGSTGEGGDRVRLIQELDQLQALGIDNLRIMAASEGPDTAPWRMTPALQPEPNKLNEDLLIGLDFLLSEMAKRDMLAVMCLNNYWQWSGGMAQYVSWSEGSEIPYPNLLDGSGWWEYMLYTARFYKNKKAKQHFQNFIKKIILRTNSLTGKKYKEDPTIMAWQLANEPRGPKYTWRYRKWLKTTAKFIKSLDSNHLVTTGSEGTTPAKFNGNRVRKDHKSPYIDYVTIHIWIQNWDWYDPMQPEASYPKAFQNAKEYLESELSKISNLNKPMVVEEFGIARDNNDHSPEAPTTWRDQYFSDLFGLIYDKAAAGTAVAGGNFWAWGGIGRPSAPKAIWKKGDDFIGDPPHEYQGWYSIYDKDESTLEVIKTFTKKMESLQFSPSEDKP